MVHSRNDQEIGVAHKEKSPENQPRFSQTMMEQYWLHITKSFQINLKCFQKVATESLNIFI